MSQLIPLPNQFSDVASTTSLAQILVQSGVFPDVRDVAQAAVKILAGRELGIGPIASLTGVHIVKGRPVVGANLMAAAVRRSGRYAYKIVRLDNEVCEIEFQLGGQPVGVSTFTIHDAKQAGLTGGDNWKKYPRNMLFARAMSNGVRWYAPDVFDAPVYTPDELGLRIDEEGNAVTTAVHRTDIVAAEVVPRLGSEQVGELERLIARKGADPGKLLGHYQAATLNDLTEEQLNHAVGLLNKRPDAKPESASTGLGDNQSTTTNEKE